MPHETEPAAEPSPGRPAPGAAVRAALSWNLLNHLCSQGVGLAVFLLLARSLEPAVFGAYALASLLVDLVANEARSAAVDTMVLGGPLSRTGARRILRRLLAGGLLAYLVLVLISIPLGRATGAHGLTGVTAVLGLGIFLAAPLAIHEARAFEQLRFRAVAVRNMAGTFASAAITLGWLAEGPVEWALVVQRLSALGVGLLVLARLSPWPDMEATPGGAAAAAGAGRTFLQIWGGQLINFALARAPEFLIGLRLGAADLGIWRVSARLVDMIQSTATSPLSGVFVPVLARYAGDREAQAAHYRKITALCALLTVPLLAGLALVAEEAVELFLKPNYRPAGRLVLLLALAALAAPFAHFRTGVLLAVRKPATAVALALADLLVTGAAVWAGAGTGLAQAAWGVLAASILGAAVSAVVVGRALQAPAASFLRPLLPAFAAAALMAGVVLLGQSLLALYGPWRLALAVLLGGASFSGYLLLAHRAWLADLLAYLRGADPRNVAS